MRKRLLRKKVISRRRNRSGETLVETLAAMVVMSLGFMMLPGAIMAAARLNYAVEQVMIAMEYDKTKIVGTSSVEIRSGEGGTLGKLTISVNGISYGDSGQELYKYEAK